MTVPRLWRPGPRERDGLCLGNRWYWCARRCRERAAWRHPLAVIVARRVGVGVLTLFVVSMLIFAATNVLPGNVAEAVLGQHSTPAVVHALEVKLGLQRSVVSRYVSWLGGMVHGDFGKSAVAVANGDPRTRRSPPVSRLLLRTA